MWYVFGWIFSAADLDYFDQWEEPTPLRRGVYSQAALNAECRRLIVLDYITRLRVPDAQRVAFVSQLFRSHHGHFSGQERHKEVVMTQLEVIRKSLTNVRIGFFVTSIRTNSGWPAGGCIMVSTGCWF
jgi:hypothetical protein